MEAKVLARRRVAATEGEGALATQQHGRTRKPSARLKPTAGAFQNAERRPTMATNVEQLEKEMQTLRAEIVRLSTDLGAIVGTAGNLASDAGSAAADTVRKTAERAGATVTKEIEERPLTSIGISFVIGLLLGALFGRSR
jgi:ElaB/YqjD/DUF883 family membrane-anchored ribosome-binding protein